MAALACESWKKLHTQPSRKSLRCWNSSSVVINRTLFHRQAVALAGCCLLGACAHDATISVDSPLSNAESLPEPDISVQIGSLSNCTNPDSRELQLSSEQPVTVIVHGCKSSAGRFRSLADVYAFHGQQTVCFNYDDRASLINSSDQLGAAISQLSKVLRKPKITIIGHSQGGLVARRALIEERDGRIDLSNLDIDLATISAPFGGIRAAAHCGSTALAWLSLGLTKPICRLITGRKYREIPPNSDFVLEPGHLMPAVKHHLKIVTDEQDSCRIRNAHGACIEDDFVFSIDEQKQDTVDGQPGLYSVVVKAGHSEIVGDGNGVPTKLIGILQQQGFLSATPAENADDLAQLLSELYLSKAESGYLD
jgi:Palmitoyl protein thioesterase